MILLLPPPPGDTGQCLVVSAQEGGDASGFEEARDAANKHLYNVQGSPITKNYLVQNVDSAKVEKPWPCETSLLAEQK